MRMRKLRAVFSWAAISLLSAVSIASAEPYMGIYAGIVFPTQNEVQFSEFRTNTLPPFLADVSSRYEGFESSSILGGKFGYFLEPLPFLGFELDVFNIFGPDMDLNRTRTLDTLFGNVIAPTSSVIDTGPEAELRVTNVMLNIVGRLPLMRSDDFPQGRLNPYIGVGGGGLMRNLTSKTDLAAMWMR